jgi:hypothetical protein
MIAGQIPADAQDSDLFVLSLPDDALTPVDCRFSRSRLRFGQDLGHTYGVPLGASTLYR